MRKFAILFIIALFSFNIPAQTGNRALDLSDYGVKIQPDKRLIVVLASLEAAGLETPLSQKGEEFRKKLKADLSGVDADLRQRMTTFIVQYRKRHPNLSNSEVIAPFISMALTLSPAPDLEEPSRNLDLPDALLEVLDYSPLVREFYRRSGIAQNLDEYVKQYQGAGDEMRPTAATMIRELLDFLHTKPQTIYTEKVTTEAKSEKSKKKTLQKTEFVERERRFFVIPELLAPKNTVNFRNIGDDYYAIVPPGTNLSNSETRRAYLQFVIDPLVMDNARHILTKKDGIKTLLDKQREKNPAISPDVFLAVARSMVVAADAKEIEFRKTNVATNQARQKLAQLKTDEEKLKVTAELQKFKETLADESALALSEAYQNGAVLSFYFARQLEGMAESGFDVAASMQEIILSIETEKEADRIAEFQAAAARAAKRKTENTGDTTASVLITENPVTKRLLEIETFIEAKNFVKADTELKTLLKTNSDPRVFYTLGRVAALAAVDIKNPEERNAKLLEAKVFYENVIRSANAGTDSELIALSYLALGRIHEYFGETNYAIKIYEAAMRNAEPTSVPYLQASEAREKLLKEQ